MENIYLKLAETELWNRAPALRPVTLDDAEDMFDEYSDEENTRYTFT